MIKHANLQLLTAYPGGVLEKTDHFGQIYKQTGSPFTVSAPPPPAFLLGGTTFSAWGVLKSLCHRYLLRGLSIVSCQKEFIK